MVKQPTNEKFEYPLTFDSETKAWEALKPFLTDALRELSQNSAASYSQSHKAVKKFFEKNHLTFPHPIVTDQEAKALLDTVFEIQEELIHHNQEEEQTLKRYGRHVREYLADYLLEVHLQYLDKMLGKGIEDGIEVLAKQLNVEDRFESHKALKRLEKKISLYREVGSFIHAQELSLSAVKVRSRSEARAKRGNLWTTDRREKYAFLEQLADDKKVCPPFTEEDLEFLVSQSSIDMLQKKTDLLLNELGYVEPNRLKANYSRLYDHLQRSKLRQSDYNRRRDLLLKLGATQDQVDYISARATYQTMKNLLKLANGKLAISDLMGGKRTITKLLRRKGKAKSNAEIMITNYLVQHENISRSIAQNYARTRKNHSLEHLKKTLNFLKENYRRMYRSHWGFPIQENVLQRALEQGLSRQKLSKRALTTKDFINDLRRALALEEALVVKEQDKLTPEARRVALTPLKEVLDYETDTDTRKQLYFIYEQFCRYGFCIPKDKLKQICLKNAGLFPTTRKVRDALEILNGAYRAIGQHGETLCVLPDYLRLPKESATQPMPQTILKQQSG